MTIATKHCNYCLKDLQVVTRCSQCKRHYYCNTVCQLKNWSKHRDECIEWKNQRLAEGNDNVLERREPLVQEISHHQHQPKQIEFPSTEQRKEHLHFLKTNEDQTPRPQHQPRRTSTPTAPEPRIVSARETPHEKTQPFLDEYVVIEPPPNSKSRKSKKSKKSKTKAKSPVLSEIKKPVPTPASQAAKVPVQQSSTGKRIHWGKVSVREFARLPGGGGGVPSEGTWALGLDDEIVQDYCVGPLDDFELRRDADLNSRTGALSASQKKLANGETRQFDYRYRVKNPLFTRLEEKQRKNLFLQVEETQERSSGTSRRSCRRRRAESGGKPPDLLHRLRTESQELEEMDEQSKKFHEYTALAGRQLEEFASIRFSREKIGCNCGNQFRNLGKLSVKKLKTLYHQIRASEGDAAEDSRVPLTKPVMVQYIREFQAKVANDRKLNPFGCSHLQLGSGHECECVMNDIPCHEDICGIWCADGLCCNPLESYHYEAKTIQMHRRQHVIQTA